VSLQHLFLNGNRNIQLSGGSFAGGFATTGLYLHDCSLHQLTYSVLHPLNHTVKYIWLNGNDIVQLDPALESVFVGLQHLRLGENPFRCDCSAVWLKRFYDNKRQVFYGAPAPSCHSPDRLRGRAFNETTVDEFLCRSPQLTRVELSANDTSTRLSCAATGQPVPVIYWIEPGGQATRYTSADVKLSDVADDDDDDDLKQLQNENEGTLTIESWGKSVFGMYICVANNDVGNATLTISVRTPPTDQLLSSRPLQLGLPAVSTPSHHLMHNTSLQSTTHHTASSLSTRLTGTMSSVTDAAVRSKSHDDHTSGSKSWFTLSQLVVAVVVSHVVTLLFYVLLATLCYWRHCTQHQFTARHAVHRKHRSSVCRPSGGYTPAAIAKLSRTSLPHSASPQHDRPAVFMHNGLAAAGHRDDFFFETAAAPYRFHDAEYR